MTNIKKPSEAKLLKLHKICAKFIEDHEIDSEDRCGDLPDNTWPEFPELLFKIGKTIGFHKREDDDD